MAPSATNSSSAHASFTPAKIEDRLDINGELVPSISSKRVDVINQAAEKLAASVYEAGPEDVDLAVAAAKAAFSAWSELDSSTRAAQLTKLSDKIEQRLHEISYLDAICMGRPVHNDYGIGVAVMRYFAGKALDLGGNTSLNTADFVNISFRQPYGVCGAIILWNISTTLLAIKVAPCLVTGNTLVLESSEKAPLSNLLIAQCALETGFPKGVLNILSGYGRPYGEAIAKHMDIRNLSFTGSAATGRAIKRPAADSNLKNATLKLGGKSPLIVFDDVDLAKAVPAAQWMKEAMTKIGASTDPLADGTLRGLQADKLQFDRVMGYLDLAKKEGLHVELGGGREHAQGYFVEPTIITGAPEDFKVVKDEVFDLALFANDTEYGLYSSVFTKDVSRAWRIAKKLEGPTQTVDRPQNVLA
ncbi:hypothetical protein DV736_g6550, partial [Chaetothyriales sp. CBS 134916]